MLNSLFGTIKKLFVHSNLLFFILHSIRPLPFIYFFAQNVVPTVIKYTF